MCRSFAIPRRTRLDIGQGTAAGAWDRTHEGAIPVAKMRLRLSWLENRGYGRGLLVFQFDHDVEVNSVGEHADLQELGETRLVGGVVAFGDGAPQARHRVR